MAPHADDSNDKIDASHGAGLLAPGKPPFSKSPPRLIIIGAGSRGTAFGKAIRDSSNGVCVGVVEPVVLKREQFGQNYIWGKSVPCEGQGFEDWRDFVTWELRRRSKVAEGEHMTEGCDGVFICLQDRMHKDVILGLAPLGIHVMCEKPLATNLEDCMTIFRSLQPMLCESPSVLFSIGHVLRYSSHNILLRKLLLEDRVIGDIMSINHTEPIGWWHFAHSFVRGDWRKQSTSAPSLLTKSCHDIDLLLWLLCSPPPGSSEPAHLPSKITSSGGLLYFRKGRKPTAAGIATNCLSCNFEPSCKYSAKRIYIGPTFPGFGAGNLEWPIDVLVPEIEECVRTGGQAAGERALLAKLADDHDEGTPAADISSRPWFGRCVYESDNDVCDNQSVTLTFEDRSDDKGEMRGAKIATFNMVALTQKVCERYTHIFGTEGQIYADSSSITVHNFSTREDKTYFPFVAAGGHGAGDGGLARQFVLAIDRVKNHGERVADAQQQYIGCSIEEVIRSHAVVFAAEDARTKQTVVDFPIWWRKNVETLSSF